ncbi:hypothetical protein W97_03926 [Coniosporium apollinis CBS 100218]|uniref:DNA binding protein SART-1 n=1 Tax=Coniosporium apollinis (strain CBS 100218) TaxID=1168221 RepID=R7YS80_CONA1|nr:uncharacterized protein W97_03926 [Coniosporium apollinis CBS 100218]EON64693.1 hypothetical protein W97_03926 [Coniosporium apollinis CBS 100218]
MDAISIEEANKIRVAMGMKPLPVPGKSSNDGPVFKESRNDNPDDEPASTLETRAAAGYDNWKKLQDEAEAKAKRQAQKDAIRKAQEKAQRFKKIEGQGLGETGGQGDMDTMTWLKTQKKRQKEIEKARKREQEEAEREAEVLKQIQYTSVDLAGVKVGHEFDQFDEGGEHILTLKDAAVDDEDEGDELENLDLRAKEKLTEKIRLARRKPVYDPNAADEDGKKTILAQYDEEIDGKKRKVFTLDGQGSTAEAASAAVGDGSHKDRGIKISLDLLKDDVPVSDYVDPSEVKISKPKKKKSKSTRKKAVDDDDIFPVQDTASAPLETGAMEIDGAAPNGSGAASRKRAFNQTDFVDDDDLQASLSMQRRAALKKQKRMRPEDLARQMREEASATPGVIESTEMPEEEPGLVIDETSEFVSNLQKPTAPEHQRRKSPAQLTARGGSEEAASPEPDADGDLSMAQPYANVNDVDDRKERSVSAAADITATGLEEEAALTTGLGSTLNTLRQRGLIGGSAGDQSEKFRKNQFFLAEKKRIEGEAEEQARLQRERDRQNGKMDHMSAREREEYARRVNQQREQYVSRKLADLFNRQYVPNVEIKHVDEFGRHMNEKEAFKNMSHQFHGKGSGKQKTEKRLKKIEDEKKREAMSTLDSSQHTGMNTAMGATARKNRLAGVRLQ